MSDLGQEIARLRKEKGLSLSWLGERSGVNRVHINKIELGHRYPSEGTLKRICKGLGVEEEVLFQHFTARSVRQSSPEERFWHYVNKTETCWNWTGHKNASGYGHFSVNYKEVVAARYAYELLVGKIPDGLELDHLCRNRGCVNPEHLEPVTQLENKTRGASARKLDLLRKAGITDEC